MRNLSLEPASLDAGGRLWPESASRDGLGRTGGLARLRGRRGLPLCDARNVSSIPASKILSEIAASWRRMTESDHADVAAPAELPEKIRPAAQAPRRENKAPALPVLDGDPVLPRSSPADAPRSVGEPITRQAAKARQLASEVTTRNIRQRLLDMALQYEKLAGTEHDAAEP